MEHTQQALAAYLSDLSLWEDAHKALSEQLQAGMLQLPRLPYQEFRKRAPEADATWLFGLWLARNVRDNMHCDTDLSDRLTQVQRLLVNLLAQPEPAAAVFDRRWFDAWDNFFFHWQSWYPGLGTAADKFLVRCDETLQQLTPDNLEQSLQAIEAFNHRAGRDLDRAARLAARIRDTELGQRKVQQARMQVKDALNEWMAGSSLPDEVFSYINHSIAPALQYYLINDKRDDWELWTDLMQTLCRFFEPNKTDEARAEFERAAPRFGARLGATKPPVNCESQEYHQFVHNVVDGVDRLIAGKGLETSIAPPMFGKKTAPRIRTHRRDQDEHNLSCGDWLLFSGTTEGDLRCQYLLQSPVSDELIFVNRLGHKVAQMSVGNYLDALDNRQVQPLAQQKVYSTAMNKAWARLVHCHSEARVKWEMHEKMARQRQAQQERERQERERAIAARKLADKAARQKAMADELARLQALKLEREAAEAQARQVLLAKRTEVAEADIAALTPGVLADIVLADNVRERCSLGMIIPSTGKYIFYDQYQRKLKEWRRAELLQQILDGNIEFYDAEPGFESRLEKIVFGQKRS
ncbi:DUF1631 family protein [Gilvimarinus sp. SDUM040013]|uniref:DUF1631 family protein n=1 Tax=Gilvimarinus gilvus TaxID=3058038 RepID=A0ABU4S2F6_9GAMM|nr:DUF1631 family protein [Gilvimarinus sp. SDUM040013]MDO3386893.1 DUF1631 family protein [Gilvimarinus sp. SDUM040013]MDX6851340.1 DUF1631 family protein [Gilvimarinus sp. SDUM040013]